MAKLAKEGLVNKVIKITIHTAIDVSVSDGEFSYIISMTRLQYIFDRKSLFSLFSRFSNVVPLLNCS